MTEQRDDDALSWAGDDDPTLDPSGAREIVHGPGEPAEEVDLRESIAVEPVPTPEPAPAATKSTASRSTAPSSTAAAAKPLEREQMSSAMLVTLGIFGGVFLLYSVGWLISAFRPDAAVPNDTVGAFMFNVGQGLAVAAGPVWMAATLWLTRGSKPYVRIAMLALGVLLVLPWPFLRGV